MGYVYVREQLGLLHTAYYVDQLHGVRFVTIFEGLPW